jgi:putative transposase
MNPQDPGPDGKRWAYLRLSIVGPLLASPPPKGELEAAILELSHKNWRHPKSGERVTFGFSTIERWFYQAQGQADPLCALSRRPRKDKGRQPSLGDAVRCALMAQYRDHPGWTTQLHKDNLVALAEQHRELGEIPSYSTVGRYMKATGLVRRHKVRTKGEQRAQERLMDYEVRSYEATHVHGLWHLDFHESSRKVLLPSGQRIKPQLLGVLDDRSRLCCHAQWYLEEECEALVHGLCQAFQKRGLPRALMMDNGGAMEAHETQQGLKRLSILPEPTLAYSPYQNAKQEVFWAQIEGRLMAMLEGVRELTLKQLNDATCAYVEMEYHRKLHSELGQTPLSRYLEGPEVGRPCPSSEQLRQAFGQNVTRSQRRSDGTVCAQGVRFEVPSRFRHLGHLTVRFARFDRAHLYLVDPTTDVVLCTLLPLDKENNADGHRRRHVPVSAEPLDLPKAPDDTEPGLAPLLKKLMADYARTGLPPAYLPSPYPSDDAEDL